MNEQPPKDPQLDDLDKRVAQLKEYLAAHRSSGPETPVVPTPGSPHSSSNTRVWMQAICIGILALLAVVAGPAGVAIFPVGLLAFFVDPHGSEQTLNFVQPLPYILYGILFIGLIVVSDRWRRILIRVLLITLALNIGGCAMMFARLKEHLQ